MKPKIFIFLIFFTLFPFLAQADPCIPKSIVIETNNQEKVLFCHSFLGNISGFPFEISGDIYYTRPSCDSEKKDLDKLEPLKFSDLSFLDKLKISLNLIFILILALSPFLLSVYLHRVMKPALIRSILSSFLFVYCLIWLLFLYLISFSLLGIFSKCFPVFWANTY